MPGWCYAVVMSEEMLDTYDRDGHFLGVKSRHACHYEDTQSYHHVVCIWVLNDRGEILVQKRAADKESNPNLWDNACGGHISAGESPLQGCVREIGEELGLPTQPTDFHFLTDWVYPEKRHFMHVYYLRTNRTPAEFVLQAEEVAAVQYYHATP